MQRTPVWTDAVHLTLARHGESEWNRLGRWQGQSDTPLSTAGVAQARALGSRLRRRKFTRIIASDLRRATVTAEAIGSPFETREEFREMHVGRWDGMARRDIDDREPGEVERCSRERDRPLGGGESHAEFFEREPCKGVHPDEVVGLGASIQGAALVEDSPEMDMVLLDVTPHTLGIMVVGGYFEELIPQNTTVPTNRSKLFTTSPSGRAAG